MLVLVLGLVIFLGVHSLRIVAEPWRGGVRARLGEQRYKGIYSLVSVAGFVLIIWGYGLARQHPVPLWTPQLWARHLASLLTLVSFVLLAAANVPGNGIKARLHHPMVIGVKVWAFAHLLANHTLADAVLFGSFLIWAALAFRAARARDRAAGTVYPPGNAGKTVVTVIAGTVVWAVFAFWLHGWLIGVQPIARP